MVLSLLRRQEDRQDTPDHLMIWSPQQEAALAKSSRWKRLRDSPYFVLAGFAGTGKTTLAKHLAAEWSGTVLVAAYTGKAAHVLRKHGLPTASTIHQLIYTPRDKCDAKLRDLERKLAKLLPSRPNRAEEALALEKAIFKERANLRRPEFTLNSDSPLQDASLLIIDEYSMVDEQVGRDLLSFQCPILALGDPGQLPPVQGRRFFTGKPDVLLTEIHRQAADNPIIRLSRDVREGRPLVPGTYGRSQVTAMTKLSPGALNEIMLGADQILVGTNKTRTSYNRVMRKLLGRESPYPEAGDKLVCLRNSHLEGLLNGQIWNVRRSTVNSVISLHLQDDDGARTACVAHRDYFDGDPDKISMAERKQANEFDFGYVLTVHKAQGSQWDDVVLVDEWRGSNRTQWLYTGITRAAETITVLQ
jgi:exodeoxyribonuclease-5